MDLVSESYTTAQLNFPNFRFTDASIIPFPISAHIVSSLVSPYVDYHGFLIHPLVIDRLRYRRKGSRHHQEEPMKEQDSPRRLLYSISGWLEASCTSVKVVRGFKSCLFFILL